MPITNSILCDANHSHMHNFHASCLLFLVRFFLLFFFASGRGVEDPDPGNESEVSSFLFFFFEAEGSGSDTATGESESESDESELSLICSAARSAFRFFATSLEISSNLMCAFARSLASCSALSRSYLSFPDYACQ